MLYYVIHNLVHLPFMLVVLIILERKKTPKNVSFIVPSIYYDLNEVRCKWCGQSLSLVREVIYLINHFVRELSCSRTLVIACLSDEGTSETSSAIIRSINVINKPDISPKKYL